MTNWLSIVTAIHLAALSQIESADNDKAIGKNGEVTRYQVAPKVWRAELAARTSPVTDPANPKLALIVAFGIWDRRAEAFRLEHRRKPSLQELYLLWHRPAVLAHGHRKATAKELERAQRFENLVLAMEPKATK